MGVGKLGGSKFWFFWKMREPIVKEYGPTGAYRRVRRKDLKLSGYVRNGTPHLSCKWRPRRVKIVPSGHKSVFEALSLLAPKPFDEISPNLVQGCSVTGSFEIVKFRGVQKLGGSKFWFFRKFLFSSFLAELCQNKQIWVKKNFGVKNLEIFRKFFITILTPPAMCNVTGLYKHDNSNCITKRN